MAPEGRRDRPGLSGELFRSPDRFEFFQAVRLLEALDRERQRAAGADPDAPRRSPVGRDDASNEVVRFRARPSLGFPGAEVSRIDEPDGSTPEMVVSFLGLTGPSGVLPRHYTELLLNRLKLRDTTLRDFLDLFNHRLTSLFYRAREKYRIAVGFERWRLDDPAGEPDPVTLGLFSLVGLGTQGLRGRLSVNDEVFLFHGGHFAHHPRSAVALESLLGDFLGSSVEVLQLQGQWLPLDRDNLAEFPTPYHPDGRNNALGVNLVVGERVWDVQSKIRLRVHGLTWREFRSLMPDGARLLPLCQVTRFYVGQELDFDVQPVLKPDEVPWCRLGSETDPSPRLGWNTWLRAGPFSRPVDDAVFALTNV